MGGRPETSCGPSLHRMEQQLAETEMDLESYQKMITSRLEARVRSFVISLSLATGLKICKRPFLCAATSLQVQSTMVARLLCPFQHLVPTLACQSAGQQASLAGMGVVTIASG